MAISSDLEVGFPFQLDTRGRVADPDYEQHVRDMLELLLFTAPGQRVNRPTFGCGFLELVFASNTAEEAAVTEHLTRAALQQWLGDVVTVTSLTIGATDSTLDVRLEYELPGLEESYVATFELRDLPWQV